jgi:hypothetical protein
MKNKIIYQLSIEDIQTVAQQQLGRNLSCNEIEKIKEGIAEKVNWFDAIANSINENIEPLGSGLAIRHFPSRHT